MNVKWPTFGFQRIRSTIIILSLLAILIPSLGGTALAYNHSAAVNYADQYALNYNSSYPTWAADCTNFASQALNAGGYKQVRGDNVSTNVKNWFGFWYSVGRR